ncbi:efflux RND transporter permease subunit [Chrysosporum bergii ANA360D]|uniref:Efflux RND transporter permease subunit n=1 Tax=Chrysosporum bergii ANA360D TaxID=617107 RepID=A0AA43GSL6_9CYAN|nr:hypothetical protein [Chrysosporum bergii]MDH6060970.1 efflux RND transporter permease subunit [Chrysosporum bergii ANA360D]
MCKTLIILILSLLLIAPTPAWALDYNGTLQSYVSKVKVELAGVVTSIQKLPSLSYNNGKTALAEIDNKLEKIKNDAGKDATYFQKLSVQAQQESNQLIDFINKLYASQNALEKEIQMNEAELKKVESRRSPLKIFVEIEEPRVIQGPPQLGGFAQAAVAKPIIIQENEFLPVGYYEQFLKKSKSERLLLESRLKPLEEKRAKLERENQTLSEGIVLTNKISKLCDQLEKRINLATQKFGNVKEYADALNSFSDPDVLTEITELNTSLAKLTENLAIPA